MRHERSMPTPDATLAFALRALVLAALLAGAAGPARAGSEGRKGTAGAMELRIPVGARGSALGGAVASDVSGVEAMFWNPAGLASLEGTDVLLSHEAYFADMKFNYAGVATRVGPMGVVGLSARVLSIGDILVTTETAPEGTGAILTPTFTVLGATWARQFTDRVNFGATLDWVSENIVDNSASGLAFDFGVQYVTDWRSLRMGMVMKNYGTSMAFSGPGFQASLRDPASDPNAGPRIFTNSSSSFEMPSYFALSTSCNLRQSSTGRLTALAAFQNNDFSGDNLRAGLEWSWREQVALRGSYFGTFNGSIDPTTGNESYSLVGGDDLYAGWSLGAGLKTRLGTDTRLGIDFAWKPVRSGAFDDIYELGVNLHF